MLHRDEGLLKPVPGLFDEDSDLDAPPPRATAAEASPTTARERGCTRDIRATYRGLLEKIKDLVRNFFAADGPPAAQMMHLGMANYYASFIMMHVFDTCCRSVSRTEGLPPGAVQVLVQLTSGASLHKTSRRLPEPDWALPLDVVQKLARQLRGKVKDVGDVRIALESQHTKYHTSASDMYTFLHSNASDGASIVGQQDASFGLEHNLANCIQLTLLSCLVAARLGLEPLVSRSCMLNDDFYNFNTAMILRRGSPGVNHLDNFKHWQRFPETTRFEYYNPLAHRAKAVDDLLMFPLWVLLSDLAMFQESCPNTPNDMVKRQVLACFDVLREKVLLATPSKDRAKIWKQTRSSWPPRVNPAAPHLGAYYDPHTKQVSL